MQPSFNVLDDSWIPVITLDGRYKKYGIRKILSEASEIAEISVESPLEEFALYRFLTVFLMDALRPQKQSDIRKLLKAGRFEKEAIEQYIAECMAEGVSFNLFDTARPFMQDARQVQSEKTIGPVSKLDCMMPSGNNHTHFNHLQDIPARLPFDQSARLLLTVQLFATAGVQGYPSGVYGAPPYFGIAHGDNLFTTLVCTLLPVQQINMSFDAPCVIWRESGEIVPKKEVSTTSWLRGMFFPARRVLLAPSDDGETVQSVFLTQGENYLGKEDWRDPFVTYRKTDKAIIPLRPGNNKTIWRSMYEVIDIPGECASRMLRQFIALTDTDTIHVVLYGVETNQAKYVNLYRQELAFTKQIAEREQAIHLLKQCTAGAETIARALRRSLIDTEILPAAEAERAAEKYYTSAENLFWKLCDDCTKMPDEQYPQLYIRWCEDIGKCAMTVHGETVAGVCLRGRELARAAEKQRSLIFEIRKLKEEAGQ